MAPRAFSSDFAACALRPGMRSAVATTQSNFLPVGKCRIEMHQAQGPRSVRLFQAEEDIDRIVAREHHRIAPVVALPVEGRRRSPSEVAGLAASS